MTVASTDYFPTIPAPSVLCRLLSEQVPLRELLVGTRVIRMALFSTCDLR